MNKVILLGRTGSDPEVKILKDNSVAKLSLATSEYYNGESHTTWHNLVFWGVQCEILKQYVHKGDQLLVEGRIQVREYEDRNKVKHWATEIICNRFELVGSKPEAKEQTKGKQPVKSMSDINDLPGAVEDDINTLADLPF